MAQAAQGAELVRRAARKRPRRNRHRRRGQEGRLPRSSSRVGAAAAAWSAMLLLPTAHMGKVGVLWAWSAMLLHPTGPQHTESTSTLRQLQAQPRHAQPRHPPRPIQCRCSPRRSPPLFPQAPASSDPMLPALREEWPAPPSRSFRFLDETQVREEWPAPPSRSFRFLDETQEAADNLMFEADRRAHELLFEAQREVDAILNAARRISAPHSPSSLPRSRSSRPASHTPGAHENDYLDRDPSPSVDHSQASERELF